MLNQPIKDAYKAFIDTLEKECAKLTGENQPTREVLTLTGLAIHASVFAAFARISPEELTVGLQEASKLCEELLQVSSSKAQSVSPAFNEVRWVD